ncbi:MAG: MaoC family dehydratase N-terminal domain-containing protein, partial [Oscillospiraceae bacterium]|nr:MaoC family dehydratase N-terminal domain-containing protein [Oscillospiraceae bacterium]
MNTYTYDEIPVGHEEQFQAVITPEHMRLFREITGDVNPLHGDAEYAASKGYPGMVAYGMLTASFLSTL